MLWPLTPKKKSKLLKQKKDQPKGFSFKLISFGEGELLNGQ